LFLSEVLALAAVYYTRGKDSTSEPGCSQPSIVDGAPE